MWIGQRIVAAALLCALGGAAYAQDRGFYVGGGAGLSKARDPADCSTPAGFTATSCVIEDGKTGWKLFLGYQLNPYVGLEAGYADLGTFKTSFTMTFVAPPPIDVSTSFHPTLYSLDVVGTLPIGGGFGLLGRIGYFRWTLDAIGTVSPPALPGILEPFHDKPTGNGVDFGAGVKWDFAANLGARFEYQRFPKIGNEDVGKSDVDLFSASLLYRF